MLAPLAPHHLRQVQQLHASLKAGDRMAALEGFDALPAAVQGHAQGLVLRAHILQAFAKLPEARDALEAAVAQAPGYAGAHAALGNLLDELGEGTRAVQALRRAAELAPDNSDVALDLALAASNAGDYALAEQAAARAIRSAPGVARGWAVMAHLERTRGNVDLAAQLYRRAIDVDAGDARSRHNLAVLLREDGRPAEALAEVEAAVTHGSVPPETAALGAHLLTDLDRPDEAVRAYRQLLALAPDHLDAQETLALLLPQLGRGGEALDGYRAALRAGPNAPALWASALKTAFALQDYEQLGRWAAEAEAVLGPSPEIRVARAAALSRLGDQRQAVDLLGDVLAAVPDHGSAHQHLAYALVVAGDPGAAERHALRAAELDPTDQAPWALLTVIWRLLEDPREAWLADYDRLVMPIDLDAAPGFFDELAARLHDWHTMREHPAEQSLRGGTQTRGNLFDRRDPLIGRLVAQIRTGVLNRLRQLPDDPSHPFLSRKTQHIAFAGSWSVRLRSEGFHIAHIHQRGWMSSALYVALPPEVGSGDAGALAFGIPDKALGLDLPPRRVERPQVGRLVIFPSYLWHGTLPFESEQPRLTVAFDALPA